MNQIPEEDLVLYYYGEAEDPEAIREHLANNAESRAEYEALCAMLDEIREYAPPEPDAFYGRRLWRSLEPRIHAEGRWRRRFAKVAPVIGLAALFVVAILIGRFWRAPDAGELTSLITQQASERVFEASVGSHLEQTQLYLTDLANTEPEVINLETQREWARQLVDDNRFYRQLAGHTGASRVADFLEELEFVLLEIANGDDPEIRTTIESIQTEQNGSEIVLRIQLMREQYKTFDQL